MAEKGLNLLEEVVIPLCSKMRILWIYDNIMRNRRLAICHIQEIVGFVLAE
jgi:hypothetical protein